MGLIQEKLKLLLSKILNLPFLDRLNQNIIWRKILKEKKVKFELKTKHAT